MTSPLAARRLYIADLARRQAALEAGQDPMNPVGYRVLAKRLRSALAGQAPARLHHDFHALSPVLLQVLSEALEARHFDEHGALRGPMAGDVRALTQSLLFRLRWPGGHLR